MTDVQKFDPSLLMQGVRDRVKATFVSLIPEDHWQNLCEKEVKAFFEVKSQNSSYSNFSDFSKICQEVLKEISELKVREFLLQYHSDNWENGNVKLNDKFRELLINNANEVLMSAFGNMFQSVIYNMRPKGY